MREIKNKIDINKKDIQKAHELYLDYRKYVDQTVILANNLAEKSSKYLDSYMSSSITMIVSIFILNLIFILLFSKLIIKSIEVPIKRCKNIAEKIANGDLSLIKNNHIERKDIIGVIDDIAFQTNLLALNAAVEASKEIKELISISTKNTEDGNVLVSKAGSIMNNILVSVNNANMLVSQISLSMIEQKNTINSITGSVSQIDDSIQQNAAMVEEMSATTDNLNNKAYSLVQSIAHFKV